MCPDCRRSLKIFSSVWKMCLFHPKPPKIFYPLWNLGPGRPIRALQIFSSFWKLCPGHLWHRWHPGPPKIFTGLCKLLPSQKPLKTLCLLCKLHPAVQISWKSSPLFKKWLLAVLPMSCAVFSSLISGSWPSKSLLNLCPYLKKVSWLSERPEITRSMINNERPIFWTSPVCYFLQRKE